MRWWSAASKRSARAICDSPTVLATSGVFAIASILRSLSSAPALRVRLNYPYRGVSSDAALAALHHLFKADVDPESLL